MIRLRPAKIEDALSLRPPGTDEAMYETWMKEHLSRGPAWAAECREGLIGCSGASVLWPGVATGWAVFNPALLKSNLLSIIRIYKGFIPRLMTEHGLRRLQTHIYNTPALLRWAKCLGFEKEGLMKSFAPDGGDCWMCGITRRAA